MNQANRKLTTAMSSLLSIIGTLTILMLIVVNFSNASALFGWGTPWGGYGYGHAGYRFDVLPFGGPWGRRWGGWGWGW
ncbi:unnamed protein product [Toxocara canis]|uniref:Uncharacterized protein n=1 Tax=Toxocara canis TaxID=6265 RepID=A0A183UID6_TOXCA|nr:unnamed protein product [Toxocara canis]